MLQTQSLIQEHTFLSALIFKLHSLRTIVNNSVHVWGRFFDMDTWTVQPYG